MEPGFAAVRRYVASAPAKVVLLGEHAVNRGQPALVTSIDRRTSCTASPSGDGRLHLVAAHRVEATSCAAFRAFHGQLEQLIAKGDRAAVRHIALTDFFAPLRFALGAFLAQRADVPLTLTWSSAIPTGAGLGSGAAAVASALLAVAAVWGEVLPTQQLAALARLGDLVAHGGLATGLDATGVVFGGVSRYSVAHGPVPLHLPALPTLVLADSGIRVATAQINARLQERLDAEPGRMDAFTAIGKLVDRAEDHFFAGDWPAVGALMNENQAMLADLGVSCPEIDALVRVARTAGAYGAKLSGSGGGGLVLALAPPERRAAVAEALRRAGGVVQQVVAGAPGARLEEAQ